MRVVALIFSLLALLSSQGLAHSCMVFGSHNQEKSQENNSNSQQMDQDHECCKKSAVSQTDGDSIPCEGSQCFETSTFNIPLSAINIKKYSEYYPYFDLLNSENLYIPLESLLDRHRYIRWKHFFNSTKNKGSHLHAPIYIVLNRLFIPIIITLV